MARVRRKVVYKVGNKTFNKKATAHRSTAHNAATRRRR